MNKLISGYRSSSKRAKILIIVAVLLSSLVLGTTAVRAAVPDSSGLITACYSTGLFGRTRIIDTTSTPNCSTGESKVSWNQNGTGSQSYNRFIKLPYGSIEEGGQPITLVSVPNLGVFKVTLCDSSGNNGVSFTNTSGSIVTTTLAQTIQPGETTNMIGDNVITAGANQSPTVAYNYKFTSGGDGISCLMGLVVN